MLHLNNAYVVLEFTFDDANGIKNYCYTSVTQLLSMKWKLLALRNCWTDFNNSSTFLLLFTLC
jgi:hypothetical protein